MKNDVLRKLLFNKRLELITRKKELYDKDLSNEYIYKYQVEKFNRVWSDISKNNKFYKFWKEKHSLVDYIDSLDDLKKFPILTKTDIRNNQDLIFDGLSNYSCCITGGSTGETISFPVSKSEKNIAYSNTYLGKDWWGIKPLDNMLMFWGHSHLFGDGYKKYINRFRRNIKDFLINTNRLNAYDMTLETIDLYYKKFCIMNPDVIVGYTSSLFKLAKYINDNNVSIGNKNNLKAIILTSESITEIDVELMSKVFHVPIVLEYGMAEAGVIAYSYKEPFRLRVFWDSYILFEDKSSLSLTTLYDKLFPLINYETTDNVSVLKSYKGSLLELNNIKGRSKDVLKINSVTGSYFELSGILIVHLLKHLPDVYGISFTQLSDNRVQVNVLSPKQLDIQKIKEDFCKKIKKDHPSIDTNSFLFVQVDSLKKSKAGKEVLIDTGG